MMQTDFAVYIGIVYSYVPFMILPLYANLEKHDHTLLEAAADLGASPTKAFFRITLPLSVPGIVAGALLVFIPAVGEYVIPSLLGRSDQLQVGDGVLAIGNPLGLSQTVTHGIIQNEYRRVLKQILDEKPAEVLKPALAA